jgi:hypothetical protein
MLALQIFKDAKGVYDSSLELISWIDKAWKYVKSS